MEPKQIVVSIVYNCIWTIDEANAIGYVHIWKPKGCQHYKQVQSYFYYRANCVLFCYFFLFLLILALNWF